MTMQDKDDTILLVTNIVLSILVFAFFVVNQVLIMKKPNGISLINIATMVNTYGFLIYMRLSRQQ